MASLADIRARLAAQENKGSSNSTFKGDNAIYAHWNINEGDSATVRFLPDGDTTNPFFWIERQMIRLPFNGVVGGEGKQVIVNVPCVEMWNETCPILTEVRTWFKDPALEEMGRKYWKKRSYLFQGFVHENPLADDTTPENPIRRFIISPQIFKTIKDSLMDPEMEEMPTDYNAGLDFRIKKTSKGGYADYSTSSWARKESALTADELEAIDAHGLHDLKGFLPNKPGDLEMKVIAEMFEASVDGQAYDPDRWASYFKPAGMNFDNAAPAPAAAPTAAPAPAAPVTESAPFEADNVAPAATVAEPAAAPAADGGSKAEDILAMIRARQS